MDQKNLCRREIAFVCQGQTGDEMANCEFFQDRYEKNHSRDCRYRSLTGECLSEAAHKAARGRDSQS